MHTRSTVATFAVIAVLSTALVVPAGPAAAAGYTVSSTETLAPGLTLSDIAGGPHPIKAVRADLGTPTLRVQYLSGAKVTDTAKLSKLAGDAGAVAAVNGDFHDRGATFAPNGAGIKDGVLRQGRSAVYNNAAAFYPAESGSLARLVSMYLKATVTLPDGTVLPSDPALQVSLNPRILDYHHLGVFTDQWGSAARASILRPTAVNVREVEIRDGLVTRVGTTVGGAVPAGSTILVGSGQAGLDLAGLRAGDPVTVAYQPVEGTPTATEPSTARDAIGAAEVVLRDGVPQASADTELRSRTGIGFSADGRTVWLVTVDDGALISEVGRILAALGADDGLNLDGGGSTGLVARSAGQTAVSLRGGFDDRNLPNALGITSSARSTSCAPAAPIYAVTTDGKMLRYLRNAPDKATGTWNTTVPQIGTGWQVYDKILAGPGGRVYGINGQGLRWYVYPGQSPWQYHHEDIAPATFARYAQAAYRDLITVDRRGDFYRVDAAGNLVVNRINETGTNWTVTADRIVATGFGDYNLIVAGDTGVIYARRADGKLFRYRFDPDNGYTQVDPIPGRPHEWSGSGWGKSSLGVISAGGDVLFGRDAAGDLWNYLHREWDDSWPVNRDIGQAWHTFRAVAAAPDTCELTTRFYQP